MSKAYLTIISAIVLIFPLTTFIVSFLYFYRRSKENDQRLANLHNTFNTFPRGKEVFNQSLVLSKLEIQEQALDHITRELHSNISHIAALININLSEIYAGSTPALQENVLETKSLAKRLMADLSSLSLTKSDDIIRTGFAKAWEQELDKINTAGRYKIIFRSTGEQYSLSSEKEIILFRLCQEILNNIVQHAKASTITSTLSYYPTHLQVEIIDDGIGFNMMETLNNRIASQENSGLIKLQKRALSIKGTVDMSSKIGKGTNFIIDIYTH